LGDLQRVERAAKGKADAPDVPGAAPSLAAHALQLLAITSLPSPVGWKPRRDELVLSILERRADPGEVFGFKGFRAQPEADAPPADAVSTLLGLAALAAVYEQTRDAEVGAVVADGADFFWRHADEGELAAAPLWLMRLERVIQRHGLRPTREAGPSVDHATRMRRLAELADTAQERLIRRPPAVGPSDVVGGYRLVAPLPDAPPAANWRSTALLQLSALAAGEPALRGERGVIDWLLDAALGARFLEALAMSETDLFFAADPREALGGIRLAPWDNRQPLAASAIALQTLTELDRLSVRLSKAASSGDGGAGARPGASD